MRFILLILFFITGGNFLFAQSYQRVYNKGFANNITATNDGGYIITGSVETNTNERIFLMKIDSAGNALWLKSYRDLVEFYSYGSSVINIHGGFLCTGMTLNDTSSSEEITLIKTDSVGNKIWAKRMGNPEGDDEPTSLLEYRNEYYVAGFTTDTSGKDFYLLKTDTAGNILDSKTFGTSGDERGVVLLPYSTGFIFGGYGVDSSGENDICLLILDSLFEINSSIRISIPGDEQLTAMHVGHDSSLFLTATHQTTANSPKSLFIKLTPALTLSWSNVLDGNLSVPYSIFDSPRAFAVTGSWAQTVFKENSYILQIDTAGNLIAPIFFGDSTGCALKSFQINNDDVVAAGYITLDSSIHSSLYLNHFSFADTLACNHFFENSFLDPISATLGTLSWQTDTPQTPSVSQAMLTSSIPLVDSMLCDPNASVGEIFLNNIFTLYPNPCDKKLSVTISGNAGNSDISIFNLFGELVYSSENISRTKNIDTENLPSGIYAIHVSSESITSSKKIIIQH